MRNYQIKFIMYGVCLLFMVSLIAFKPYAKINRDLGLSSDSLATVDSLFARAEVLPDSLIVAQTAAIIVQPSVSDSLAKQAEEKVKLAAYWAEQIKLAEAKISELKPLVHKRQAEIQKLGQSLVKLDEVERLLTAQNSRQGGVNRPRDKTGTETDEKGSQTKN